jgi:hypothetical protein
LTGFGAHPSGAKAFVCPAFFRTTEFVPWYKANF